MKISEWACQWKISLNPDVSKHVQEVDFSRKKTISNQPVAFFSNLRIKRKPFHKHFDLFLHKKLNFLSILMEKAKKYITTNTNLLRNLSLILPRCSLLIIYKSFVKPHLAYGDTVYAQPNSTSLSNKTESLQYNEDLAITGAIRSSSKVSSSETLNCSFKVSEKPH